MEDLPGFSKAVIEETGVLDQLGVENEAISVARAMVKDEPKIWAFLLECSCLPPCGRAIQEAVTRKCQSLRRHAPARLLRHWIPEKPEKIK